MRDGVLKCGRSILCCRKKRKSCGCSSYDALVPPRHKKSEQSGYPSWQNTVRVKITCPNLREEYSSCGPYKFTYNIAYAHARRSNGSCTALCVQRTKSSQSLVRGTAIVEAWVY